MRIIIAGTRTFKNLTLMKKKLDKLLSKMNEITIITGGAPGADKMAQQWAFQYRKREAGINIGLPVINYYADWKKHKKAAGPIRNQEMVDNADGLIAFWDGISPGTKDVIRKAKKKGLKVTVINI